MSIIIALFIFSAILAISWAMTCGIIYAIALCFSLPFTLPIATGIWLILLLLGLVFGRSSSK